MPTSRSSRLYYTKFEKAAESNLRNVALLDGKCYYPFERILRKLDIVSFVRLSRTCSELNKRMQSVRGLQYPFDMGILHMNYSSMTIWKHGVRQWNVGIASKTYKENPNLMPHISKIHFSPVFQKGMYERLIPVLCKIGVGQVMEMCIRKVERNAWDELKEFVTTYRISKVTFFSRIPDEQQLSYTFLTMNELEQKGNWTRSYILNTTRSCFHLRSDFVVDSQLMFDILARWHTEPLGFWRLTTSEMNFIYECKRRYHIVAMDQTSDFPKQRPLLCDLGESVYGRCLALLRNDGRLICIECKQCTYNSGIRIASFLRNKYPLVFKRILGIQ